MRNQYLIGGWYTPPCSKEQFRLFRECGLNTIFLVNNELPEEAELRRDWRERALSFCDDCGIFAYIQPDKGMTPRESAEIIAPFRSHPSPLTSRRAAIFPFCVRSAAFTPISFRGKIALSIFCRLTEVKRVSGILIGGT